MSELIDLRDQHLRKTYREIISVQGLNARYLPRKRIVDMVLLSPAPRFYISGHHAKEITTQYANGKVFNKTLPEQMVVDLLTAYRKLQAEEPYRSSASLWEDVVEMPAPRFYLSHHRLVEILFNYKHCKR